MGGDSFQKKSELRRFFVEGLSEDLISVSIDGDEFTHLKRVLRLSVGAEVSVFDGKGVEITGVVAEVGSSFATIKVTARSTARRESTVQITLLQGLLKGDKPELVIQKATELGAASVVFFAAQRTVPSINAKSGKPERWKRAAIEAAKQCGRSVLPEVSVAKSLTEAVEGRKEELKLMLWEGASAAPIKDKLKKAASAALLIGPEGGFSEEEVKLAQEAGFVPVSLGPRILRAETAALAAISIVQYAIGDLG